MKNLLKSFTGITMLAFVMLLGTSMSSSIFSETLEITNANESFFTDHADLSSTDLSPASYVCGNWNLKYRRSCGSCSYQDQSGKNYNFRIVRYTKLCYYPNSPEFSWVIDTGDLCHEACY